VVFDDMRVNTETDRQTSTLIAIGLLRTPAGGEVTTAVRQSFKLIYTKQEVIVETA